MSETKRLLTLYKSMLRIRRFEEAVSRNFRDGLIPGIVHLSIGQEAVAAGVSANLRPDDYVLSTHRAHGHLLLKGAPAEALMAEIWGKSTGVCRGNGGSMHISHLPSGALAANSIVGASQPFASGVAMSIEYHGGDQIVASYFGDGAVTSGGFHEGLVMASTFSLPILYIAENNGYSETTGARFHLRGGTITDALSGYGFRSRFVDGMDVEAVDSAASELSAWVRANRRPAVLECETYRYHGHFEGDPATYRTQEEVKKWRARDPVQLTREKLLSRGVEQESIERVEADVQQEIDRAVRFADSSPLPDPTPTLQGVYAT